MHAKISSICRCLDVRSSVSVSALLFASSSKGIISVPSSCLHGGVEFSTVWVLPGCFSMPPTSLRGVWFQQEKLGDQFRIWPFCLVLGRCQHQPLQTPCLCCPTVSPFPILSGAQPRTFAAETDSSENMLNHSAETTVPAGKLLAGNGLVEGASPAEPR